MQSHSLNSGWKGPQETTSSICLLKEGLITAQVDHGFIQPRLEYPHGGRMHHYSGQPFPVFDHLHGEELLPCLQSAFPLMQLMATALALLLSSSAKSLALPPIQLPSGSKAFTEAPSAISSLG